MAAEGNNNSIWFTYTSEDGEEIPDDATHVFVVGTTIPARAFQYHRNIVEVICHEDVERIEAYTFCNCRSLKRLIMPGVKIAEECACSGCGALTDIECGKLEIVEKWTFAHCKSLRSINLSSAEIIKNYAFNVCKALTDVKFGKKLERIDEGAFCECTSLERITVPLKDGMITMDDIFVACERLNHVDLVEGAELHEYIAALQLEDWRNDMNGEIDSINQNLPDTYAGEWDDDIDDYDEGGMALTIRDWIRSVLGKIIHYKAEHQRALDEAGTTLQLALPPDIVVNYVFSFFELPPHRFGVDAREDAGNDM